jgi:glycosyltransferase involved in cell wall biosynthesis
VVLELKKVKKNRRTASLAIVVPCRNGARYLRETLESLGNQKERPDRIILSDNMSTDNSRQIMTNFSVNESISEIVSPAKYLGEVGQSFNFAASFANEDWIFFLHSDDVLSPKAVRKIRRQISITDSNVGLIAFEAEWIDVDSKLTRAKFASGRRKTESGFKFVTDNLSGSSINFGAVVLNNRIFNEIGCFEDNNSYWLDLKYYHKLVSLGYAIKRVSTPILRYRIHQEPRLADNREEIHINNQSHWHEEYLPELARKLRIDLSQSESPQSLRVQIKLFLKRENRTKHALRKVLLCARILMDRTGLGMFAS